MTILTKLGALALLGAGATSALGCGSGGESEASSAGGGSSASSGAVTSGSGGTSTVGSGGNSSGGGGGTGGTGGTGGSGGAGPVCEGDQIVGEGAPLAAMGPCGKLVYRTYKNRDDAASVNRLPDFSYAGYERGGVAIPDVPVVATVDPKAGDDGASIQAAIDLVSKEPLGPGGFRGAVLLHKGKYEVGSTLFIKADGVVLRGEGQGTDGTIVVATAAKQYALIEIQGSGSGFGEVAGTRTPITTAMVPVGSRSFDVKSAAGYAVGDAVVVLRTPNQKWIDDVTMGPFGWTKEAYTIPHERTITAVNGNQITIDIPIVDTMEATYGGGSLYKSSIVGRLRHAGVEDLRLDSVYASDTDEDHGWTAVELARATSSWVRRVTAVHFGYSAVLISASSAFNTVEDVAMLDPKSQVTGGRRYAFNVENGIGTLFQRCYSQRGRHNFVTGARVTGPHVWLDCVATEGSNDDGPHHRWATGLLFDSTRSAQLRVQNRKESGTGHGWAGAQTLFWNADAGTLVCDAPKGAMSWSIGCTGKKVEGQWAPEEPEGWWESFGTPVEPRSLYLQQLHDRLGQPAVDAVTLPAQRKGRIWDQIATWAGQGRLETFLP